MLFKIDTLFGHVIEDTPDGPIYQDDGTRVDFKSPRACLGCGARCQEGTHDPCIASLPGTSQACCGHGRELTPVHKRPAGYVALTDGRTIQFAGTVGGERIRLAVQAAIAGEQLPDGFAFGERMWWEGLTEPQRAYVNERITAGLVRLVTEALGGTPPAEAEAILRGEKMWFNGLSEGEKGYVWQRLPGMLSELVQEALANA